MARGDVPARQYIDDNRDDPLMALRIFHDDQGDWYVSVGFATDAFHPNCVRLCASGGAVTAAPGLRQAIASAFVAMGPEREVKE